MQEERFEPVSCSFFLLFWNVRTTSWNFPRSRKETRSRIFTLLADWNLADVAVHVSYATHIASLHYIENFSTYVVLRGHLYIAYNDTSLLEHREVKRSRSIMHKYRRTCELCVSYASCMSLFGIVLHAVHVIITCYTRVVHVLCVRTGLDRFEPHFSRNMFWTTFLAKCVQMHVLIWYCSACCTRDVHVLRACCARVVRQNRFKPGKTQEKSAPSAVAIGYINRSATAITITTVLRSLQSTSIQHHSHAAALRDTATVAVHQVLQVSIIYYLCLYEC